MPVTQSPGFQPDVTNYGIALQLLTDAAKHLAADRVYFDDPNAGKAEEEAIRLLSRRSREIFDEYTEVLGRRCSGSSRWFSGRAAGAI
jgi:hypothetical protein